MLSYWLLVVPSVPRMKGDEHGNLLHSKASVGHHHVWLLSPPQIIYITASIILKCNQVRSTCYHGYYFNIIYVFLHPISAHRVIVPSGSKSLAK